MYKATTVGVFMLFVLAIIAVGQARAELLMSPDQIAEMKQAATDVFQIEVIEVIDVKVADTKGVKRNTLITARVVTVERSDDHLMRGEQIEIASYDVSLDRLPDDPESAVIELLDTVFVAHSAPQINRGWKGTVYLKAMDAQSDTKRYGFAAYQHSVEPADVATDSP